MIGFVRRHRNKLTGVACAVGGAYAVYRYALYKFAEYQTIAAEDGRAKEQIRVRFKRNMEDCLVCIGAELPVFQELLFDAFPVERLTAQIAQTDDRAAKRALFEDLKGACFARTVAALYLVAGVSGLLHVQLNLVGRRVYVNSVVSYRAAEPGAAEARVEGQLSTGLSPRVDTLFLSLLWHLGHDGWRILVDRVQKSVASATADFSVARRVAPEDIVTLLNSIRAGVFEAGIASWAPILLPKEGGELETLAAAAGGPVAKADAAELAPLLAETRDLVESADFSRVLDAVADDMFAVLAERMRAQVFPESDAKIADADDALVPLPKLLPWLARQAAAALAGSPNPYLQPVGDSPALRAFSAVIYAGFDEADGRRSPA